MALGKRFRSKKGRRAPRKRIRMTRQVRNSVLPMRMNLMSVVRKVHLGTISHAPNTWTAYPYTFKGTDLPNYSEYQALFDYYKINAVKLTFVPYFTEVGLNDQHASTSYGGQPRVYTIIDKNGIAGGAISTENRMLEYANVKLIREPLKSFSIYIRHPAVEVAVEGTVAGGATASTSLNMARRWLDTGVGNTPHFGCAVGWTLPSTSTTTISYHVIGTYYLQFKGVN